MMCNASQLSLSSENARYAIFLYVAEIQEATYEIGQLGVEGQGKMCKLDSENVVLGLKECVFTCECDLGKCSNIFLNVMEREMDICEIDEP